MSDTFAVIDLGTNTFQLLIGKVVNQKLIKIEEQKIRVKLGENGINNKFITEDAIQRGKAALLQIKQKIHSFPILALKVKATSALRSASNGKSILDLFEKTIENSIDLIDGIEEANYIAKSALYFRPSNFPQLIVDIGGGSVECVLMDNNKAVYTKSLEIGAQRLLDSFKTKDKFNSDKIAAIHSHLAPWFEGVIKETKRLKVNTLIGTSGSFDTLRELNFDQNKTNGFDLSALEISALAQKIYGLSLANRKALAGMSPLRADLIPYGCCILEHLLFNTAIEKITCCPHSLKEGVLLEMALGQ